MKPRPRSPNYPHTGLPGALERLERVWKALQSHAAARGVILDAMGYHTRSGAADRKFSALRQFGLLDSVGKGKYRISELGKTYLHPRSIEERNQVIEKIAAIPNVFAALQEEFPGELPGDTLVRNFLIREGYSETGAKQALRSFSETVSFLKSEFGETDKETTKDKKPDKPNESAETKSDLDSNLFPKQETRIGNNQFAVSITSDFHVTIAANKLKRASLEKLIQWLEVNKEFVAIDNEKEK